MATRNVTSELLTVTQTAKLLGVSRTYIKLLIREKRLPAYKISDMLNSPYVIQRKDIDAFVKTWKRNKRLNADSDYSE